MSPVTLLDEELALLAPDAAPLPWLDGLDEGALAGALQSAARGLLVRGLATSTPEGLRPAADLEALEEALRAPRALRLVTATPDGPPVPLTVLRPSGPGVLVQDVTADGVHLFTEVDGEGAARLLRSALEPPACHPGQAVVRVLLSGPDVADEVLLLVADGGRVLEGPPDGAGPGRPLDGPALDALAARLLTDLLGRPEGAVRPRCGSG